MDFRGEEALAERAADGEYGLSRVPVAPSEHHHVVLTLNLAAMVNTRCSTLAVKCDPGAGPDPDPELWM